MAMRNPLRSEGEAYRFLWIVVGGAIVIVVGAAINKWLGVAVAVIAFVALGRWFFREPVPGAADPPQSEVLATPEGRHRVLVVAPPGTESVTVPEGVDVRIVVPAIASLTESVTGAVDDRRADAEATAAALGEQIGAQAEVGADDPALAVEDALRVFGADEVLVVGGDEWMDAIRERVAIPVSRA
jgi:hypothetical protein